MVILGLLLILLGAVAVVLGVTQLSGTDSSVLGADLGTRQIFVLGIAAALAVVVGLLILQFAARRSMKRRRERKRLNELHDQLEAAEAERDDRDREPDHRRD